MPVVQYKLGDKCTTGQTIDMILGQSDTVCVYTSADNNLRWEYFANNNQLPNSLIPAIATFNSHMTRIATHVPKPGQKSAYHLLGKALHSALHDGQGDTIDGYFLHVEKHIWHQSLQHARFVYVVASLIAGLVLTFGILAAWGTIEWYAPPKTTVLRFLFLTPIMGVAGALVSILQRSGELNLDPASNVNFVRLQGVARIILGALFGVFIALASKGNILLSFANDNEYTLCALSIVAGFSERFAPEIMRKIEAGQVEGLKETGSPKT